MRKLVSVLSACDQKHVITHKPEAQITKRDLSQTDLLFLIRPTSICALELAKAARRSGIFLCVMYDDDLINIPRGPFYEHFHWRRNYAKRTLAISDFLLSPNHLLLAEYKAYMKKPRALVLQPCVTGIEERFAPVSSEKTPLKVIYAAGADHSPYFNRIIGPAMKPLFEKYPGKFAFTFLGVKPDPSLFPADASVERLPMMPFRDFISVLKNGSFDIGLAPLEETPFSNRKGIIKYIDYSMSGALGIFSDCLPYTSVIRSGENGLLVKNTPEEWLKALSFCEENPQELKRMAKAAQNDLLQNYLPDRLVESLKKEVPEFFSFTRHTGKVHFFKNPLSHCLFAFRHMWNQKFLTSKTIWPLTEKARNLSERFKERGFFSAMKYYLKRR